ncbi:MAG TPA: histidinol-phosphatase HisJ family protein [Firmicutes bacterium]|nr:histidinol-phosphatase HisJ family protein [Bacillota bacterium]
MDSRPHPSPLVSYHGGHTLFDGTGEPEAFVVRAIEQGFTAFGFSEHMPPPDPYSYTDFPTFDEARHLFDGYVEEIFRLKSAYRDELPVLVGVEIEYLPDKESVITDFLNAYPFDYTVGSVHFIGNHTFDFSKEAYDAGVRAFGGMDPWVEEYYRLVRSLLDMGVTDVLGHLDIIKIFADDVAGYRSERVRGAERETLEAALRAGVVLDVNARGLIKACAEVYPGPELLAEAQRMGVPATLGDDSHRVDQVGARLDQALDAIRAAGYLTLTALLPEGESIIRRALPI